MTILVHLPSPLGQLIILIHSPSILALTFHSLTFRRLLSNPPFTLKIFSNSIFSRLHLKRAPFTSIFFTYLADCYYPYSPSLFAVLLLRSVFLTDFTTDLPPLSTAPIKNPHLCYFFHRSYHKSTSLVFLPQILSQIHISLYLSLIQSFTDPTKYLFSEILFGKFASFFHRFSQKSTSLLFLFHRSYREPHFFIPVTKLPFLRLG